MGDSTNDQLETSDPDNTFFSQIEEDLGTSIPIFLKAILISCGCNDPFTLSRITDKDVSESVCSFIDSPDGLSLLKETLQRIQEKSHPEKIENQYWKSPSSFLKIPSTRLRLAGIQDYFAKSKKPTFDKNKNKNSHASRKSSHLQTGASNAQENSESSVSADASKNASSQILKTLDSAISRLKIAPSDKDCLATPTIELYFAGASNLHAKLKCAVCDKNKKEDGQKLTIYRKGKNTWQVHNYIRHIERSHLLVEPRKNERTLENFWKKPTEQEANNVTENDSFQESVTCEPDQEHFMLLSDDEEEALREGAGLAAGLDSPPPLPRQTPPLKKWKSRLEKTQAGLVKAAETDPVGYHQSKLTEFFDVINELQLKLKENQELEKFVQHLSDRLVSEQAKAENMAVISEMPRLLRALVEAHETNKSRSKNGFRYRDQLIRDFSALSRDLGGKQCYEFWSKNLPLPSPSAVAAHNDKASQPLVEGKFRFQELGQHLDDLGLERQVHLSEDGTRIKGGVDFDSKSNQLVGFTPPLDKNGCPAIASFNANSAEDILKHFQTEDLSNCCYAIMAQPLADVPAFQLCAFGTNNRFTAIDVEKRWKWMEAEALKHGIKILGFSSDGDGKLLRAMKKWTFRASFYVLPQWEKFFFAPMDSNDENLAEGQPGHPVMTPLCIQDTTHSAGKLKNQLLKQRSDENYLLLGEYVASSSFLHFLVKDESKLVHGLSKSDLLSDDKMNFRCIEKMCDNRVLEALNSVPGANGTRIYLLMTKYVCDSFLMKDLKATERVRMIWCANIFFRLWREWLQNKSHSPQNHFISGNVYQCVEINAHSLVNVIRRLRILSKPHLFVPWKMDSQPTERNFGDIRSCTPTFSTVINVSMLQLLQRSRKIQRITEKKHQLNKEEGVIVPRHHKKMQHAKAAADKLTEENLPSDEELRKAILHATQDALGHASDLGMKFKELPSSVPFFILNIWRSKESQCEEEEAEDEDADEVEQEESINDQEQEEHMPADVALDVLLQNESQNNMDLSQTSPFVLFTENGKQYVIKKSALVWRLSSKKYFTCDRLERVKAAEESLQNRAIAVSEVQVCESLNLTDWVVFDICPFPNKIHVGRILSFCYLSGTGKSKQYSDWSVPTSEPVQNARGIGCLGQWFTVALNGCGKLLSFNDKPIYHNINKYVCTLPSPYLINGAISYPPQVLEAVAKLARLTKKNNQTIKRKLETSANQTRVKCGRPTSTPPCSDSEDSDSHQPSTSSRSKPKHSRLITPSSDSDSNASDNPLSSHPGSSTRNKGVYRRNLKNNIMSDTSDSDSASRKQSPSRVVSCRIFPPLSRNPLEEDYVLVEFPGKKSSKFYVARVLDEIDLDQDLQVSYLRRQANGKFSVPIVKDLASVQLSDIKVILPKPSCPDSKRHEYLYDFAFDFSGLDVQ